MTSSSSTSRASRANPSVSGPTGVTIYEGPSLPGCPTGTVLNCDAGAGVVYGHVPSRKGAGFALQKTVFMQVKKGSGG